MGSPFAYHVGMASRISQPDRLLMGTLGNLEGLKRRFPSFRGIDPEKIQAAIKSADDLTNKLTAMLGQSSDQTPEELERAARDESDTRSAAQESASRCPPNAD